MKDRGTTKIDWLDYHHDWQESEGEVIEEIVLTINVNGEELISLMGTPLNQDWLAVGFLFNEGLISELSEIEDLRISEDGCCIDVWLSHQIEKPSSSLRLPRLSSRACINLKATPAPVRSLPG